MPKFIPTLEDVVYAWQNGCVCASGEMSTDGEVIYSYDQEIVRTSFYHVLVLESWPTKATQKHLAAVLRVFTTTGSRYPFTRVPDLDAADKAHEYGFWEGVEDTLHQHTQFVTIGDCR